MMERNNCSRTASKIITAIMRLQTERDASENSKGPHKESTTHQDDVYEYVAEC